MNWSALIRQRRENLQLTQMELAVNAGVSLPSIQNMEAGRANPSLKTLESVLNTLGVGIEYTILDGDTKTTTETQATEAKASSAKSTKSKKKETKKKAGKAKREEKPVIETKPATVSDLTSAAVDSLALFDDEPSSAEKAAEAVTEPVEKPEKVKARGKDKEKKLKKGKKGKGKEKDKVEAKSEEPTPTTETAEVTWPEPPDLKADPPRKNQDLGDVLWEVGSELGELRHGSAIERAGKLVKIFGKIADRKR